MVPVLTPNMLDMAIIMWTERTKHNILQAAGLLMKDLEPYQYTHAVLNLQKRMQKGEIFHSNCSDNLRLLGNTLDSHLSSLTDHTLRQLYSLIMKVGGV